MATWELWAVHSDGLALTQALWNMWGQWGLVPTYFWPFIFKGLLLATGECSAAILYVVALES